MYEEVRDNGVCGFEGGEDEDGYGGRGGEVDVGRDVGRGAGKGVVPGESTASGTTRW